jgi:hypothetical protein
MMVVWRTSLFHIILTIKGIKKLNIDQKLIRSSCALMYLYTHAYVQVVISWLVYKYFVWIWESLYMHFY